MHLLSLEIKKLFKIKTLLIIFLTSFIIYSFASHRIIYSTPKNEDKFASMLLDRYGSYIDNNEFTDFKNLVSTETPKLEEEFLKEEILIDANIKSFDEYEKKLNEYKKIDSRTVDMQKFINLQSNKSYLTYKFYKDTLKNYNLTEITPIYPDITHHATQWIKNTRLDETTKSPITYKHLRSFESLMLSIFIMIGLSTTFICSNIFLKDSFSKVDYLQYSSKIGKKILKTKLLAGLISTFIISSIIIFIILGLYGQNGHFKYWDCSISSELLGNYIRYLNVSFGDFVLISIGLAYILSFGISAMTMYLSLKHTSYVSLFGASTLGTIFLILISYFGIDLFMCSLSIASLLQIATWILIFILGSIFLVSIIRKSKKLMI